jgi:hypothetical protein
MASETPHVLVWVVEVEELVALETVPMKLQDWSLEWSELLLLMALVFLM